MLILTIWFSVALGPGSPAFANQDAALSQNCQSHPRYLQVKHHFPWPAEKQAAYAGYFETACLSSPYLNDLTAKIQKRLAVDNVRVKQIIILPAQSADVISVRIITDQDPVSGNGGAELSVLLPLRKPTSGTIITSVEIVGEAQEGDELIARYTVNEKAYLQGGGKLVLQWLRDGQVIEGATKSRYRLVKNDVGATIEASLRYETDTVALADARNAILRTPILAANYPPEIQDLTIEGQAETGQTLTARYRFFDENEGDVEGDTSFLWLRDNIAIADATGPNYVLGAGDIDKQISVRVIPQSQDGQTGAARSATLAQTVKPKAIVPSQEVVDNTINEEGKRTLDAKALEETIAQSVPREVDIAVPLPRPDVPKPDEVLADIAEAITKKDEPAIIIDDEESSDLVVADKDEPVMTDDQDASDEKAPEVVVKTVEPPVELTPGFAIAATSPKIFKGLDFGTSAILLEHELKKPENLVRDTPITLEAIKTVLDEVNALYLAKGFELSRALLPEQIVTDGIVSIQLVEATIGKITLENRENLKEEFIREHLASKEGDYISLAALAASIRTYNLSNKSKLATELAPGEAFGETDIFVDVAEPDKVELPSVSVNNYANQTSDWRQNAISITLNNVYGIDDETALSYTDSQGSTSMSGSFSMPIDAKGTNISVALSSSDTKIVAGSEETVGYRGSSSSLAATYSRPIVLGDDYSVYLSTSYGQSKSDLVQPVTGDMLSKSEVRKYSLSVPYSYNNGTTAFSIAPSAHVLNVITKIPEREKWMQKINVDMNASHFLSDKWTLNGRGQLLYTRARDMINMPSEILSVGGPSSVRAYQPAESSGYQGYFVTGELRTDLANWEQITLPSFMPSAQTYLFVDHMLAQSQYNVRSRADYWSGYGIGLQIPSIFNLLTFDIYWSEPLDGEVHAEEKEFYDDEMFQFSLSARFRLN